MHPEKREYTFFRRTPYVMFSRLVSEDLASKLIKAKHVSGFMSDHSRVEIVWTFSDEQERGPGFWKFNSLLLNDETFVKDVTD